MSDHRKNAEPPTNDLKRKQKVRSETEDKSSGKKAKQRTKPPKDASAPGSSERRRFEWKIGSEEPVELHNVFPDKAVKMAFVEVGFERGDDVIVNLVRSKLPTICVMEILRQAIVSCLLHGRKFVHITDIEFAERTSSFPMYDKLDENKILEPQYFGAFCNAHIRILSNYYDGVYTSDAPEIKMSQETLLRMQSCTEAMIRGFLRYFAKRALAHNKKTSNYETVNTYRLFDVCLDEFLGKPRHSLKYYTEPFPI